MKCFNYLLTRVLTEVTPKRMENWRFQHGNLQELILLTNLLILIWNGSQVAASGTADFGTSIWRHFSASLFSTC